MKNSVLVDIRYKQLNWYGHVQKNNKKGYLEKCWNDVRLEEEEKEDLEIRRSTGENGEGK